MSGSQQVAEPPDGGAPPPDERGEIEARAQRMGWKPREQYRGPADKWVDADEYVERGERMMPLLQERNRSLDRTVQTLQTQLAQQGETLASLVQTTRRAEQVGYNRARRELEERRAKAVAEADTAGFNAAEREIQELGPPPPADPPTRAAAAPAGGNGAAPGGNGAGQGVNPVVAAWVSRNPWFNSSKRANGFAIGLLSELEATDPSATLEQNLAEVEMQARQTFPELFPARRRAPAMANGEDDDAPPANPRRAAAPLVAPSGSAPARRPGPRSFEALPAEAKREYERQKSMLDGKGEPFTKEEYARYYFEAEGE